MVECLPDDPVVAALLAKHGVYGGTAHITFIEWHTFSNVALPLSISADMRMFLPNLAKRWELSETAAA